MFSDFLVIFQVVFHHSNCHRNGTSISLSILNEMKRYFSSLLSLLILMALCAGSFAQSLPVSFFKERRDALRSLMPENSVFVVFAYPERTYSGDTDYPYHANPDLYYFSGYTDPNAVFLIFKEPQTFKGLDKPVSELLFAQPSNPNQERWTGKKMNARQAMEGLGIEAALDAGKFKFFPIDFSKYKVIILDLLPEDVRIDISNPNDLFHLIAQFREKTGIPKNPTRISLMINNIVVSRNSPAQKILIDSLLHEHFNFLLFDRLTSELRQVKTEDELQVLRKAIDITCRGQVEAMKAIDPDMSEREIQGIQEFMYKKGGAENVGFPSIVASGNNSCVLHYMENSAEHVGSSMIVMDVGAEYHGYSGDVTRSVPGNGKFSPEQLAIYNLVLAAHDSALHQVKAGFPYDQLDDIGLYVIGTGLIKLGIIKNLWEVQTYYPHGISHPIGLDVHDKYLMGTRLMKNMVITLEPGIYIPEGSKCDKKWWGIGIRIEDDVLVLDNHGEVLSGSAPIRPKEIEKLMKMKSPLNQVK